MAQKKTIKEQEKQLEQQQERIKKKQRMIREEKRKKETRAKIIIGGVLISHPPREISEYIIKHVSERDKQVIRDVYPHLLDDGGKTQ